MTCTITGSKLYSYLYTMQTKQTQKIAERTRKGVVTGNVFCLETITGDKVLGKHYFFSMLDGEFGEPYARVMYYRLPKKIKNRFA